MGLDHFCKMCQTSYSFDEHPASVRRVIARVHIQIRDTYSGDELDAVLLV